MHKRISGFLKALTASGPATSTMASKHYRLIAGLGNPGRKYERTRHNIGFMLVDRLSQRYGISLNSHKFKADYGAGRMDGIDVILVKPMSYMNNSGEPLRQVAKYFKVSPADILVVHDDLDLPWEDIKIKINGGHGGHNGLRSIIKAFGTGDFKRIRIGIGRSSEHVGVTDYVLGKFDKSDQDCLGEVIARAGDAVVTILTEGPQIAMNKFHGRRK